MRPVPPPHLVERLERLHLATPAQVAAVGARVRRLAGELLEFESVWIDALAQAKLITSWQASELNAGRGDQLVCGSYSLTGRLADPGFAECYLARHFESTEVVRLYVCNRPQRSAGETLVELKALAERDLSADGLPAVFDCGSNGKSVWAVCPAIVGTGVSGWLAENGRMPPAAVLQIARAMVGQLALLERHGLAHGDICVAGMLIDRTGAVVLPAPGLRGIVRPQEGIGFAELRPAAYDYLAPERVAGGTPPDIASELYACGAVWWHLLAGRSPMAGGNSRAKLQAVQAARVIDIRSIAQGVPCKLAEVIAQCLISNRDQRPASFAQLAETLGPPTEAGRELLASLQRSPMGTWQNLRTAAPRNTRRNAKRPLAIGAACVAILLLAGTPLLLQIHTAETAAQDSLAFVSRANLPSPPAPRPLPTEEPKVDPAVSPTSATLPLEERAESQRVVEDLVLPTGEVLKVETLELEPRIRVRGRGGRRPLVSVPAQGILVDCENVTFEGIDFVWQTPAADDKVVTADRAMVRLQAQTVNFRGCSFSSRSTVPPDAIRTVPSRQRLGGFGVEVALTDCVFDGIRSVVNHNSGEAVAARLENCLCVASGPILQLARSPTEDNEIQLLLERVTTRGDTAVLRIQNSRGLGKIGPIAITASGCALAGTSHTGLISLVDPPSPEALIRAIVWNGQGSVMSPRMSMLTSQSLSGGTEPLADDQLVVAGLVRGELEFAGRADGPPADSRIMRWQVPLRSAEPPGADPDRLHSLRSKRVE